MSFPTAHTYHADSDADDEYERSILTSPMPPTDDETSSIGDSEHGSHEHTPTTFEAADYGRASPRTIITEWSTDECAGFLTGIGLGQYGRAFRGKHAEQHYSVRIERTTADTEAQKMRLSAKPSFNCIMKS